MRDNDGAGPALSGPAAVVEIACDESGSEGENLIGGETDVFVHGSVRLTTESAESCVQEIRRRIGSPAEEYKANHLLRQKHRAVLVWFLGPTGPIHGTAHVHLIDKLYFLVGKIIDSLGPVDNPRALATTLYRDGPRTVEAEQWQAFLWSFNDLMRVKNRRGARTTIDSFFHLVDTLRRGSTPGGVHDIMEQLWQAKSHVDAFRTQLFDNPLVPALDPLIPGITHTIAHWSSGGKLVSIVHHQQPTFTEDFLTQLKAIRVTSLRLVPSRTNSRVQIADFLAGVARRIASDELNARGDAELTALLRPYVDPSSIWGDPRSWSLLAPSQANAGASTGPQ